MNSPSKIASFVIALSVVALVAGCDRSPPASPGQQATPVAPPVLSKAITQAEQAAMSPDQALVRLSEGNARFIGGKSLHRDYPAEVRATSAAQYPFAVVLSCIDSRSTPEVVFDQGIGDLFVPRIAGNYVQADILGSMEFATKISGAKLVVVLGHTECGAIKGACDNVELGNLTTVIQALRPAVEEVKEPTTDRNSKNKAFVSAVTTANVRRTVARIRQDSAIMRQLEESGQLKVVGALQDLATGEVTFMK